MVPVLQLQIPASVECRRGCGRPAQVEVVDLPDVAQGDHLATLAAVLPRLDQPSALQLCRLCAGEPAGWDHYRELEGLAEQIARAA